MVSLTCSAAATDGVTLVTARLDGTGVVLRVRLANRLDGPVWPPRREGVPEAGWDEDGVEVVVPADGTVAVGYASPAPPVESPVEVVERTVVAGDGRRDGSDRPTPESALRDLGDPSPPRDAVPDPTGDADADGERSEVPEPAIEPGSDVIPDAVGAWLDEVEGRVSTAERLTRAETVPEATSALREAGSLDDAGALVDDLAADAEALELVAGRADRLAGRADDVDVPLATLERFA